MQTITLKKQKGSLTQKENYRKINYDSITGTKETINKVILKFQKEDLLNKNISEGVRTERPKISHFYMKTKIHKEGNPGRLITN